MGTRAPEGPGPWYQGDPQTGWPPAPRTPLPGSTPAGPGGSRTPGSGLGARTIAALVAAGLALVGLGFGAGYVVRGAGKTGAGTTSTSTHQSSPRGAVWQFTPLSANTVCGSGGDRKVVAALKSVQQGSVPPRLSDQTPRTSALGGYWAVCFTDMFQFMFLFPIAVALAVLSCAAAGGWTGFVERAPAGFLNPLGGEYGWLFLLAFTVSQTIGYNNFANAQRYFCADTERSARKIALLCMALFTAGSFVFYLPAILLWLATILVAAALGWKAVRLGVRVLFAGKKPAHVPA